MTRLFFVFLLLIFTPIYSFGFEIKDLTSYSGVAIKTFTTRDSMYGEHSNNRIMGSQSFVNLFGSTKATFETEYTYIGDKTITEYGKIEWKYYTPPSWNGRGKGEFKYPSNNVMKSGKVGDLLIVGKKNQNEMALILIQKDNPAIDEVYNILELKKNDKTAKEEKSFWSKLWESESKDTAEYDLGELPQIDTKAPENGWMEVYFTPSTLCEDHIIENIDKAKKNINIAVYSITNQKIVDSLIKSKEKGIKIRILTDRLQASGRYSLVPKLRENGFEIKINGKEHKIMHHKFAIFDNKHIESGSFNWTKHASQSNAENCTFFDEPSDKPFSNEFEKLWKKYN